MTDTLALAGAAQAAPAWMSWAGWIGTALLALSPFLVPLFVKLAISWRARIEVEHNRAGTILDAAIYAAYWGTQKVKQSLSPEARKTWAAPVEFAEKFTAAYFEAAGVKPDRNTITEAVLEAAAFHAKKKIAGSQLP